MAYIKGGINVDVKLARKMLRTKSLIEVAKFFGCSDSGLRRHLAKLGVTSPRSRGQRFSICKK